MLIYLSIQYNKTFQMPGMWSSSHSVLKSQESRAVGEVHHTHLSRIEIPTQSSHTDFQYWVHWESEATQRKSFLIVYKRVVLYSLINLPVLHKYKTSQCQFTNTKWLMSIHKTNQANVNSWTYFAAEITLTSGNSNIPYGPNCKLTLSVLM